MGIDRSDQRLTPTAAEIRERCQAIQATWTRRQRVLRGETPCHVGLTPVRLPGVGREDGADHVADHHYHQT